MEVKYIVPKRLVPAFAFPWMLAVVAAACLSAQYSGLNARVFGRFSLFVASAMGRFVELFPSAIIGYGLWMLREKRSLVLIVGLIAILLYVVAMLGRWDFVLPGFSYQGIRLSCLALGLASLAVWSDIDCNHPFLARMIRGGASVSAGIYYVHLLVGKFFELFMGRHRGFAETAVVFVWSACFVLCVARIRRLSWLVK